MLKNVSANWVLTFVQIVVAFAIMPFAIKMLGHDQYGTWILISSLTSYLWMLTLGVPMATVRFIAKYSATGEQEQLDRTLGSCGGLYVLIGVGALIVGAGLLAIFHFGYHVSPSLRSRADLAFAIVVLNIASSFFAHLPYGIMAAHRDFVVMNKIQISSQVLRLGLVYTFLSLDASLVWLAVVQVTMMVFEFTISSRIARRRYPNIRIRFRNFHWGTVRTIFGFSVFVLLLQVGGKLAFQTDALVIGAYLPISTIPFFSVAGSFGVYLVQFVIGISDVMMPTVTALDAQGAREQLQGAFLKWSKISSSLTLLPVLFLFVLGPRFVGWWIGPAFEGPSGAVLRILMVGYLFFLPARGVSLPTLVGLGYPGRATVAFLVAAVVNLGLSILLVRPLGIEGVALGTTIPNVVYAVYIAVVACRSLDLPIASYVGYVFGRPFLGALPVVLLLVVLRNAVDVRGILQLVAAGALTVLCFALTSVGFVYRADPRVDLSKWLGWIPWRA